MASLMTYAEFLQKKVEEMKISQANDIRSNANDSKLNEGDKASRVRYSPESARRFPFLPVKSVPWPPIRRAVTPQGVRLPSVNSVRLPSVNSVRLPSVNSGVTPQSVSLPSAEDAATINNLTEQEIKVIDDAIEAESAAQTVVDKPSIGIQEILEKARTMDVPQSWWLDNKLKEDHFRATVSSGQLHPYHGLVEMNRTPPVCMSDDVNPDRLIRSIKLPNYNTEWIRGPIIKRINPVLGDILGVNEKHEGVVLAGGAMWSYFTGNIVEDFDLFLVGYDEDGAMQKIESIVAKLGCDFTLEIVRTEHAFTITTNNRSKIQIILRLYSSISEVLHGFDVDCCRVGYDGNKIWATSSAEWAWKNRVNVVDFDRMSPSYDYRMAKYAQRGFAVYVPQFDVTKTHLYRLVDIRERIRSQPAFEKNAPRGLSRILYFCYTDNFVQSLGDSDYDPDKALMRAEIGDDYESRVRVIRRRDGKICAVKCTDKPMLGDLYISRDYYDEELVIPRRIEFIKTNPGQQSTGTFHPTVLKDKTEWYNGELYTM